MPRSAPPASRTLLRHEKLVRERLLDRPPDVHMADDDVGVAIEQARQDRPTVELDCIVAIEPTADRDDPAVLDRDIPVGRIRAGAVEDAAPVEDRPRH
jgi:hypothetical protein